MAQTLTPIMTGAEVITRPTIFILATGTEIRCDPSDPASLDAVEAAIHDAARRRGIRWQGHVHVGSPSTWRHRSHSVLP